MYVRCSLFFSQARSSLADPCRRNLTQRSPRTQSNTTQTLSQHTDVPPITERKFWAASCVVVSTAVRLSHLQRLRSGLTSLPESAPLRFVLGAASTLSSVLVLASRSRRSSCERCTTTGLLETWHRRLTPIKPEGSTGKIAPLRKSLLFRFCVFRKAGSDFICLPKAATRWSPQWSSSLRESWSLRSSDVCLPAIAWATVGASG